MTNILKISEAASLALHTMYMLTKNEDRLISTKEIATFLDVSENHLAKVLQRLVKAGLIDSIRGPKGGFKLAKDSSKITLLEIYEVIEGPLKLSDCLLNHQICCGDKCILGSLITKINTEVKDYLSNKKLSEFNGTL